MGNSSAQNGLGIIQLYLLQSLLLFPFILILLKLLIRLGDSFFAFLVVAAIASIYTTKAFFWDYIFWFDGIAYFFLLMGMYLRNRTGIFFALQLACWTDERAAIALFSIYLFHLLQENNFVLGNKVKYVPSFWKQNSTVVLLCFITYISLRMGIGSYFHLSTPLGYDAKVGLELVLFQIKYKAIGMFLTFEGLWILYFWVLFLLWRKKHYGLCGLLAVAMLGHTVLAYCVYDISRSLSYAFPLIIISFAFLEKFKSNYNQVFIGLATLSCILIPTQYIIFSVNPIPLTILSGKEMYIVAGNISKLIFGI